MTKGVAWQAHEVPTRHTKDVGYSQPPSVTETTSARPLLHILFTWAGEAVSHVSLLESQPLLPRLCRSSGVCVFVSFSPVISSKCPFSASPGSLCCRTSRDSTQHTRALIFLLPHPKYTYYHRHPLPSASITHLRIQESSRSPAVASPCYLLGGPSIHTKCNPPYRCPFKRMSSTIKCCTTRPSSQTKDPVVNTAFKQANVGYLKKQ